MHLRSRTAAVAKPSRSALEIQIACNCAVCSSLENSHTLRLGLRHSRAPALKRVGASHAATTVSGPSKIVRLTTSVFAT